MNDERKQLSLSHAVHHLFMVVWDWHYFATQPTPTLDSSGNFLDERHGLAVCLGWVKNQC